MISNHPCSTAVGVGDFLTDVSTGILEDERLIKDERDAATLVGVNFRVSVEDCLDDNTTGALKGLEEVEAGLVDDVSFTEVVADVEVSLDDETAGVLKGLEEVEAGLGDDVSFI